MTMVASGDESHALQQKLNQQWRIWRHIIDAEQQANQPTTDAFAAVLGQATPKIAVREGVTQRFITMYGRQQAATIRQQVAFVYDVLAHRQRALTDAMQRDAVQQKQSLPTTDTVTRALYALIDRELKGDADPKAEGRAGLVYWNQDAPELHDKPNVWFAVPSLATAPADFADSVKRRNKKDVNVKKAVVIFAGLGLALLLFLTLMFRLVFRSNATLVQSNAVALINGQKSGTWQSQTITISDESHTVPGLMVALSTPLLLCTDQDEATLAWLKTTAAITVTTVSSVRVYTRDAAEIINRPDIQIVACTDQTASYFQGTIGTVQMSDALALKDLVTVAVWASDIAPTEIAPTSVRVDLIWKTNGYSSVQLMTLDGNKYAPANQVQLDATRWRVSYLIPASPIYPQIGLILDREQQLPLQAVVQLPPAMNRETWLDQRFAVSFTAPVWSQGGLGVTMIVTPTLTTKDVIPPVLLARDVRVTQNSSTVDVQWQPPTQAVLAPQQFGLQIPVTADRGDFDISFGLTQTSYRWSP